MIRPYRPSKQSINQPRIGNILDPLGNDKKWTNVWGAVMNVPQPSGGVPVSPTPTPSVTPTNTVTPTASVTPTSTVTPTVTPTSTVTPSVTPTSTITPSVTPTNTVTPTPTITPSVTPTNTVTPTPSSTPPASGTTEANTYLTAVVNAGGTLDSTISAATRTLFTSLVSNGLWDKLDTFYPHIGGVSAAHALNGKNPSLYSITFNGGWTFNNSFGSKGNGVNSYGTNTRWNPLLFGTQNDVALSLYVTTLTSGSYVDMILDSGTGTFIGVVPWQTGSHAPGYAVNDGFTSLAGRNDSRGYFTMSRKNATTNKLFINGSLYNTATINSITPINDSIVLGANKVVGFTPSANSNRAYGFNHYGLGLTDAEMTTLSTIINTFQTSLGRNVY